MKSHRTAATGLAAAIALTGTLGLASCATDTASASSSSETSSSSAATRPAPEAVIPAVTGGTTAVTLDQGFVDALGTLGLTPGTVGGTTLEGGVATFPVTGGTVTYYDPASGYRPYVQGVLLHEGAGLSLTAGETMVALDGFTITPGKPARLFGDVHVNGELVAPSAPLFDLDGTTLMPLTTAADGSAVLSGTRVLLSPEAATLLNQTFGTDALAGGFLIGTSEITVR